MRVSELIPDKDSLVTRNYWWKRTQLGLPAPEFEPTVGFANLRQPSENQAINLKPRATRSTNSPNQPTSQQGNRSEMDRSGLDQTGSQQNDDAIQQGGVQSQQNQSESQATQNLSAQQRGTKGSLAEAQSNSSTRFETSAQRTETRLLAPELDWNYAAIERLDPDTLKTTLLPFDLGKLVLQHDASQDLELHAGDVLYIFSEADIRVPVAQQTKLVKLEGEFVHAGSYAAQPGETLRNLIERAGGFTPNAYLYGSEFARETTRAIQQARIDEYVQSLNMEVQRGNLATGSTAPSTEPELVTRLRQIRATGRIVLEFKADSIGTASLPDVTLEDGDSFVVPSAPASINVVGAVYDQNSFLFHPGRRAGEYFRLAGGPNRNADRKHEFIIRADGEVISHHLAKGPWGNEFNNLRLNPGDTIVVPDKTFRPSALRGISDWSQLFSQLALGAAALRVI